MSWTDHRLVAFDLETTSAEPEEARIVTAAVVFLGGQEPTKLTWLVNAGVEIPAEAAAIHGVTTERARAEGMDFHEALVQILDALRCAPEKGWPIIAFNARYDLTVLDREARRAHLEPLPVDDLRVIDPLVLDKWLDRYRKGSRKLDAICAHYNAKLDEAHEAFADALAAARAAWVIGRHGRVVRRTRNSREAIELAELEAVWELVRGDLDRLHEAQVWMARDQALSLADYFREEGKADEAARVQTSWPVVPWVPVPWACPCGEQDLANRYGGPGDHDDEPDAPCERCVMDAFSEHG